MITCLLASLCLLCLYIDSTIKKNKLQQFVDKVEKTEGIPWPLMNKLIENGGSQVKMQFGGNFSDEMLRAINEYVLHGWSYYMADGQRVIFYKEGNNQ